MKISLLDIGIGNEVDEFYVIPNSNADLQLLVIAPGNLSIPPKGWGAVETIIHETIQSYQTAGFEISILNSKSIFTWIKARRNSYDVILLHVDNYANRTKKIFRGIPIVCVTHYGLILSPNLWHRTYKKTIGMLRKLTAVGCLSLEVYNQLVNHIDPEKLFISSNGSELDPKIGRNKEGPFIYLGRIETRKRQFEMYEKYRNSGVEIVFVGEIIDSRVSELIEAQPDVKKYFPGSWNRQKLSEHLCEFRGLILLSEGEADALVLYEAQLAGIPIFCNLKSIGAQNSSLSWVHIIDENIEPNQLVLLSDSVKANPEDVAEFARTNYNWNNRNIVLVSKLIELARKIEN